jgi:oxygen-dependent protoporphyrinogen oxidase
MTVAIVGGGISGLSTAYYLAKAGISSTLIEARPRLGGVIRTEHVQGCVVEAGPDSFLSVKPAAMDLIRELGLAAEVIGSNDHLRKTYVWKRGRMVPLPDGLMMMIPTRILPMLASPLLSWPTKVRMGLELLRGPVSGTAEDRSVAEFVAAHYGDEAVDYLAEPLLSGIYGGNPDELSVRSVLPKFVELESKYGSLTRGVIAERRAATQPNHVPLFRTLKGGLGQLVDALAVAIRERVTVKHGEAEAVERNGEGFRIRMGGDWLDADRVVLACEAHRAAKLVPDARIADLLETVRYGSSMTVAFGFAMRDFPRPLDGFGFLVPKRERRRLVACTWVGTKFAHRVPEGQVLLRCFLSGTDESDDAVAAAVLDELHAMLGFTARPSFSRIFRWPRSMAQYPVGHQGRMAELSERLKPIPGLHLAGNAYEGIGIPDCIRMGKQAAQSISNLH